MSSAEAGAAVSLVQWTPAALLAASDMVCQHGGGQASAALRGNQLRVVEPKRL
jgi:hypothetical protein